MNNSPVGFFDSGIGGTCVLEAFKKACPFESTVYLADKARCPYGNKSRAEILEISRENVAALLRMPCKAVVVACNTASAAAIDDLRKENAGIPFIALEPAIKPAALKTRSGVVGVLATAGTFGGRLYRETKEKFASNVRVVASVADDFVELVERGIVDGPLVESAVKNRIGPLLEEGCDEIVLGCTHFPHLKAAIERYVDGRAQIIDPSRAVAERIKSVLAEKDLLNSGNMAASHLYIDTSQGKGKEV